MRRKLRLSKLEAVLIYGTEYGNLKQIFSWLSYCSLRGKK
jgi:hypothetical protein